MVKRIHFSRGSALCGGRVLKVKRGRVSVKIRPGIYADLSLPTARELFKEDRKSNG